MKPKGAGFLLAIVLAVLLLPVYVFAFDSRPVAVSVNGNRVMISGENGSYAGRSVTLRLADRFSRTIVADEVQAQAGGSYSFGPYTLEDGVYTAYVGGAGAVETKEFNVDTQVALTAPSSSRHKGSGGVTANTGTISGVAGGTLTLSGITIVVPAGAMDGSIQVTIDKLSETTSLPFDETLFKISDVYEITKDGDREFSKPVTITLPYDKSREGSDKSKVGIYWLNEQTRSWIRLTDLKVDESNSTVSGTVTHFTKYAVMASKEPAAQMAQNSELAVNFSDIQGHWAETAVFQLVKQGAITGYPDNTFKPNDRITRAEFVTLIVNAFGFKAQNGKSFADTSKHWAQSVISTASALDIADGYSENVFGPDDWITREQMAAIIIRAARIDSTEPMFVQFSDNSSVSNWAKTSLATAAAKGLIDGYEDGTVKPKANATRAEAATVILRALQKK